MWKVWLCVECLGLGSFLGVRGAFSFMRVSEILLGKMVMVIV